MLLPEGLRASDENCFSYFNLGRVHERLGEWHRAVECYKDALRISPQYGPAALARLRGLMS